MRYYIANEPVFNAKNDAQQLLFDDLFWKRLFNSYVYKISNVYDRKINQYQIGVNALLESEKIMNMLENIESDIWKY